MQYLSDNSIVSTKEALVEYHDKMITSHKRKCVMTKMGMATQ